MKDKVQEAYDSIGEKYHRYITVIKGNPYMQVDGRVAMFIDDHEATHANFSITTCFSEVGGQLVAVATVQSNLRGTVTGHAKAFMDAERGVDATNPLENAETSAVGRALGFLGYGLFGCGIASANEVETAIASREEPKDKPQPVPESDERKAQKTHWVRARKAMSETNKTEDMMREYCKKVLGVESTKDLTEVEWQEVIDWLGVPQIVGPPDLIDATDDIPEPETVSWGHVKARCAEKEVDWNAFSRYVLSKNKSFGKSDIWELPDVVAKRYTRNLEGEELIQLRKEVARF